MRCRNATRNGGLDHENVIWLGEAASVPPAKPRGIGWRGRLIILITGGCLLIILVTFGTYVALSPTAIPRFRLVGRWVEVDAYSDEFRSSGSEIRFGVLGDCSQLTYVRGASAFTHDQRGRWSLQEVNGDEMTVHVRWEAGPNGPQSSTAQVFHISFDSPRRIEICSDGSMATHTYERR